MTITQTITDKLNVALCVRHGMTNDMPMSKTSAKLFALALSCTRVIMSTSMCAGLLAWRPIAADEQDACLLTVKSLVDSIHGAHGARQI